MSPKLSIVDCSVAAGSVVVIGSEFTCDFSENVPLLQMSTQHLGTSLHMISFTRPSLALALQAINARSKRPGIRLLGYDSVCITPVFYLALFLCQAECRRLFQTVDYLALSPL